MKSTVVLRGKAKQEFPRLMVADDGEIVLFTSPKCGTVMNDTWKRLGATNKEWAMHLFEDFNGTVTLEN